MTLRPELAMLMPPGPRRGRCRPAGRRATVSLVNAPDNRAAADGNVSPDPPKQERLLQLAEEQAALRRVATLVAREVPPEEVFAAVVEEAGRVLSPGYAHLGRYDPDGVLTWVATQDGGAGGFPAGSQWSLGGRNLATLVFETGRPARADGYADASGALGTSARERGVGSTAGTPVIVEGRLWGVVVVGTWRGQRLPADTEVRLASFAELMATAIANADSRAALARLAEEQAALRRVATLVARGAAPEAVFAAVAEEVVQLLPVDQAALCRYEPDGVLTFVGQWGRVTARFPVGSRWMLGGHNVGTLVFQTGRPARVDYNDKISSGPIGAGIREAGLRSAIGTPILVEGRLWGTISVASLREQPLPADAEARLVSFTELVATAIAKADSRAELMASRARIVAAADESRRRIQRDLHDGIQQQLVSLILDLRTVQASVPAGLA
jgi:GAF domain-containing protein